MRKVETIKMRRRESHRRTGIFLPGGGGKPIAQKNLAGCPNFYERVGKKGGPYYNNVGRTDI